MSELPQNWVEVSFLEIFDYVSRGKSPKYIDFSALPVINQKSIRWSGIENRHLKYIDPAQIKDWPPEKFVQVGDILWNSTGTGTIGRACIVKEKDIDIAKVFDSHVTVLQTNANFIDSNFVFFEN
jgi:type I restriction enzyme, S subunit